MRMINKVLGRFGLQLVNKVEAETSAAINEANIEAHRGTIRDLQQEMSEMRERNRELLKRMARHVASAHYYNLGKEGLVLDLKDPRDLARAQALAARADVVIKSARPGVMTKLGLGFDAVKALNPGVVYELPEVLPPRSVSR